MSAKISDGVFDMAYVFNSDNHETENDQTAYQSIFVEFKFNGNIYPNGNEKYIILVEGMEFEDTTTFAFYLNTTFNNVKGREQDNTLLYAQIAGRFFNHNYMCDARGNRPCLLYSTWDLSDRIDKQIWVSWGDSTQVKKLKPITALTVTLFNTTNGKKSKTLEYITPSPLFIYSDWANEELPVFGSYLKGEEFCCRCGSWTFATHGACNNKGKFFTYYEGYFLNNESKSGSVQIYSGTNHDTEYWWAYTYFFTFNYDIPTSDNPYVKAKNLLYDRTITSFDDTQETNHFVANDRILYKPHGCVFVTITETFKSDTLTKEVTRVHRCGCVEQPIDSTMGMLIDFGVGWSAYFGRQLGILRDIEHSLVPVKVFEGYATQYYDLDTSSYIPSTEIPAGSLVDRTLYLQNSEMTIVSTMPRFTYVNYLPLTWYTHDCEFLVGVPGFNQTNVNTFFDPELEFITADIENVITHFNFTPQVIPTLVGNGSYTGYNFGSWITYFDAQHYPYYSDYGPLYHYPCVIDIFPISDNLGWHVDTTAIELTFIRNTIPTVVEVNRADWVTNSEGTYYIKYDLRTIYTDILSHTDVPAESEFWNNVDIYVKELPSNYINKATLDNDYITLIFRFLLS